MLAFLSPWALSQAADFQVANFQIVWVDVGDAASIAGASPVRAGRHIFMASDVADLVLKQVSVGRVDVSPEVKPMQVGERFCLTSLRIVTTDATGEVVKGAPLTVSVRQDQRDEMGLEVRRKDICLRPAVPGEYPIRFTSALPARDGTARGAQIFVRVTAPSASEPGESGAATQR